MKIEYRILEVESIKTQQKTPLFDALKKYGERNVVPFDVPGHKHGNGLLEFKEYFGDTMLEVDVNSMKPLDFLGNPVGVIKESQDLMAEAYGSDEAYFLVNGTTSGVQAMVMSTCEPGDKILLPRNAHKSATNALILSGAEPVYIQPEVDENLGFAVGITLESVKEAFLIHKDIKAVFVINPTYYGTVSDLESIIKFAHDKGAVVLVDEAHGAHFKFSNKLPKSAMELGADMAAVSLHKTGGALTQSSALLANKARIDCDRVKTILNLTQTTSASYLLMSSLDVSRKNLACNGEEILSNIIELVEEARCEINKIDGMYAFGKELIGNSGIHDFDVTKLSVNVRELGITGYQVYDILRDEYNIQAELGDMYNILAIVSVGDSKESLSTLVEALKDIAYKYRNSIKKPFNLKNHSPEVAISPREAFYAYKTKKPLDECEGYISGESIMVYPPGIPIVAPGERITKDIIEYIRFLKKEKCMLNGAEDPYVDYISVINLSDEKIV